MHPQLPSAHPKEPVATNYAVNAGVGGEVKRLESSTRRTRSCASSAHGAAGLRLFAVAIRSQGGNVCSGDGSESIRHPGSQAGREFSRIVVGVSSFAHRADRGRGSTKRCCSVFLRHA